MRSASLPRWSCRSAARRLPPACGSALVMQSRYPESRDRHAVLADYSRVGPWDTSTVGLRKETALDSLQAWCLSLLQSDLSACSGSRRRSCQYAPLGNELNGCMVLWRSCCNQHFRSHVDNRRGQNNGIRIFTCICRILFAALKNVQAPHKQVAEDSRILCAVQMECLTNF